MSDGPILNGQQYDQSKDLVIRYTEQSRDATSAATALGNTRTEITPRDRDNSVVKIFTDPTGLDTLVISGRSNARLSLPDVLNSITVVYNVNAGDGSYSENAGGSSGGDHDDLTISSQGSAEGSAGASAELIFDISPFSDWGRSVPSTKYFFYMTGVVNTTTILARLNTIIGTPVLDLPMFKAKPHMLVVKGQSISVRAEAKATQFKYDSPTFNASKLELGSGSSFSSQLSVRAIQVSPTIHGTITISNNQTIVSAHADAQATILGGLNFPYAQVTKSVQSPPQVASVTPTSLAATTPTSIPTTGLYLVDSSFEPDKEWGRTKVFAEVVDFSIFA